MKTIFRKFSFSVLRFPLAVLLVWGLVGGITSCQSEKDYFGAEITPGEVVAIQLSPGLPAGITPLSSGDGGAGILDEATYDLRYILEVWSADGNTIEHRDVKVAADYNTGVNFQVELLAKTYKFVFWADFVTKGTTDDLTYITGNATGLQDVEWDVSTYYLGENLRDAYYAVEDINLSTSGVTSYPVTLRRPFGKLRILATDVQAAITGGGNPPDKVVLTYTHDAGSPEFRKSFNALTGLPNATAIDATGSFECAPEYEASVEVGGVTYNDVWFLAFDYFLVPEGLTAVSFDIELFDSGNNSLGAKSVSNVPIGKNKLTTVIGNVLLPTADLDVNIGDDFGTSSAVGGGNLPIPSGLQHTVADYTNVTLSWKTNTDADSYEIDLNGVSYNSTTSPKVFNDLEEATNYAWKVRTIKEGKYSEWSYVRNFQTGAVPFIDKAAGNWGATDAVVNFNSKDFTADMDNLLSRSHATSPVGVANAVSGDNLLMTVTGMTAAITGGIASTTSFNIDGQLVNLPLVLNESAGKVSATKALSSDNVYTKNMNVLISSIDGLEALVNDGTVWNMVKNKHITSIGIRVNSITVTGTPGTAGNATYNFVYDVAVVSLVIDFTSFEKTLINSFTDYDPDNLAALFPTPQYLLSEVVCTK
jgi:hypothetical protein